MRIIREICRCGLYLTDRVNDKSCRTTIEMTPVWMVSVSYTLRQLGIRQWRTIEFAFEYNVGSARMVKESTQFLPVPFRPQFEFNPRRLLRTRSIVQNSKLQAFAEYAGDPHRLMLALSNALLQKTQGNVPDVR